MEHTELKTGYEWCLEANVRLLNLLDWDTGGDFMFCEDSYFKEKIDAETFKSRIANCKVKPNSQPRKTSLYLEYRMYGLVPYNISDKQKGIQYGHAVVRYGRMLRKNPDLKHILDIYDKWADNDETFIILDGGTTNNSFTYVGSMNKYLAILHEAGVLVQDFYEPDLGDQLSALCFLVDERVFNRELYPDFVPETIPWGRKKPSQTQLTELAERNEANHQHWVEKIGGERNAFLRTFLKPLKRA